MKKYLLLVLLVMALSASRGQTITTVAGGNGPGTDSNQFYYCYGVFIDRGGNIYVSDQNNARIQKFPAGSSSATDAVTVAGGNGIGNAGNQLSNPTGVFVDSAGYLYVADQGNARVLKFPPGSTSATNGVEVGGTNRAGNAADQLNDPTGVWVDRQGNIYVADADNDRIQMFAPGSSNAVTVAGGNGLGDYAYQLSYPTSVFVDSSGNIYVSDFLNNRIQMFPAGSDTTTSAVTVAGGNGMGNTAVQLNSPTGVFVDRSGNIYVADYYNNRIQLFPPGSTSTTSGVTVAGGNGEGNAAVQLNNATTIYVDTAGDIYIADFLNNRIQKWGPTPAGLSSISAAGNNIALYPNPNSGSFILQSSNSTGQEYTIYDVVGRAAVQGIITSDKQSIEEESLSAGAYILEIKGSAAQAIRFTVVN